MSTTTTTTTTADVKKHYELNSRYGKVGDKNVWVEFTALARDYNAVNLGQGFPDYPSVTYMNKIVNDTVNESTSLVHQYTRSPVFYLNINQFIILIY